jgi:hypothetical protein
VALISHVSHFYYNNCECRVGRRFGFRARGKLILRTSDYCETNKEQDSSESHAVLYMTNDLRICITNRRCSPQLLHVPERCRSICRIRKCEIAHKVKHQSQAATCKKASVGHVRNLDAEFNMCTYLVNL